MELVSGWSDNEYVYLVERANPDGDVKIRRMRAKWSAFFTGLDDADRLTLQRTREVVGLQVQGKYTRVDFSNRWARKDILWKLGQAIEGANASGSEWEVGEDKASILEGDVNPLRRFMSDHGQVTVSASPRLAWFDLETDSRVSFFDAVENGKARILAWSITELVNGEARLVASAVLEEDTDAAERALIEAFLIKCRRYDVLLAWSGSGFDFPVLEKRADAVRARPGGLYPQWQRWCFLDCMEVFKKYHAHVHESGEEKTSFKLNSIAQAVVGQGKKDFSVTHTWDSWRAGGAERQRLLEYNEQDSLLMPKIEAKTGYVALHIAVCSVTRCFPDSRSLMASQQGDGFLLRLGEIHGHRWPTKRHTDDAGGHYAGAYVMEPTRTGIIENVHVADFASLYPSIIRSWNISPETVMWRLTKEPPEGVCRVPYTDMVKFSKARRGMFPLALDELVQRRAVYSKKQDEAEPGSPDWERYKRLSGAYKIVANSFYGIMGSAFARFYDSTAAEAVTQTGAWLIKHVAAKSTEKGLQAFYGDTDSVFVSGESKVFSQVVADLNQSWKPTMQDLGCDDCHVKLEFEKSFSRIVLIVAKRYIGRFSLYKGKPVTTRKVEIKGLEYKRGDTIRLARAMQKELIDLLLDDAAPTAKACRELVDRWRKRVFEGELTVDDIVLSQSVKGLDEYVERYTSDKCSGQGKNKCAFTFTSKEVSADTPAKCPRCGKPRNIAPFPAHVRVARILAERGEEIRSGTRVEYLIVSKEDEKLEVMPARDEGVLEKIDRAYYWTSRVYPATARVLESAFPNEAWTETPAERKKRRLQVEVERNRGVVHDLPLFARALEQIPVRRRVKKVLAGN